MAGEATIILGNIKHDRVMRQGGLLSFKVLNRRLINSFSVNNQNLGLKDDTRRPLLRVMNGKIIKRLWMPPAKASNGLCFQGH